MSSSFLYLHCSDVSQARDFYTALLGLEEIYFSEEERSVGYRVGSLQVTVSEHAEARQLDEWSRQLGWKGGTSPNPSWGFQLEAQLFRDAVERLRSHHIKTFHDEPRWVGYWSFPVNDPMGNTVEVTSTDADAWG